MLLNINNKKMSIDWFALDEPCIDQLTFNEFKFTIVSKFGVTHFLLKLYLAQLINYFFIFY
jgi:hypothetical protein